jgi:hypothetical protein
MLQNHHVAIELRSVFISGDFLISRKIYHHLGWCACTYACKTAAILAV